MAVTAPKAGTRKSYDPRSVVRPISSVPTDAGFQRVFEIDGSKFRGVWAEFHMTHKEALDSACAVFDLVIEVRPVADLTAMGRGSITACEVNGQGAVQQENFLQGWSDTLSSVGARILLPIWRLES